MSVRLNVLGLYASPGISADFFLRCSKIKGGGVMVGSLLTHQHCRDLEI